MEIQPKLVIGYPTKFKTSLVQQDNGEELPIFPVSYDPHTINENFLHSLT